ncbi:WD40 repeat [Kalmanozyma brasiliensis GHG001]|uniref:Uncharacterized protein n=1 Tax=Kalmanozyma brasiliensis (strain GHG001) TaxID=1365824 RepID=V5EUZ5_KALBG|nr:WD40 repeat [Kalmanozyma brasiliensis GHG001]EST09235.1 WD40 repeat [Kalmanozyma brasiliensis GHG001]
MPDAFFQKKRKRNTSSAGPSSRAGPSRSQPSSSKTKSRMRKTDSSSDEDDDAAGGGIDDLDLRHNYANDANSDDEAEASETPAEARVRLAKMYLSGLSSTTTPTGDDDFFESDSPSFGLADAAVADRENIAARLQKDVAEQSGRVHVFLSDRLSAPTSTLAVRGHRLSVTSAVASSDARWLFTAGKDGSIIRWSLRDGRMVRVFPKQSKRLESNGEAVPPSGVGKSKSSGAARRRSRLSKSDTYLTVGQDQGHTDEIFTLSLSSDGQHLASGGKDRRVCIWRITPSSDTFLKTLSGHKDAITALSFRLGSHELLTASLDRTLKLYDISQLSYIETLFGHQESVLSLSCLSAETAVSAGGRDRTCRFWKIRDESQLVFRAGIRSKLRSVLEGGELSKPDLGAPHEALEGSVDVVAMIDNHHFVSGGDSGTISLWNLGRKKPIFSVPVAHGFDVTHSETEGEIRTPRWVVSLGAMAFGDVFVSGSWDGSVRVWGLTLASGQVKGFRELFTVDVPGVVNSLQIVQPPINSVVQDPQTRMVQSTAVRAEEYRRRGGLDQPSTRPTEKEGEKGEKLPRVKATKENAPPIVIVGVGQEHKFGRWIQDKTAKNGALVIPLLLTDTAASGGEKRRANSEANADRFKLV